MRYLLIGVLGASLAGCGTMQQKVQGTLSPGLADALTNVSTTTVADEQVDAAAAIKLALAATPAPDTEFSNCLTYLQGAGAPLIGQLTSLNTPLCDASVCVLSAFEKTRLALMGGLNAVSPTSNVALETACGPLAMSVRSQGVAAAAEATALLAALGIKVAAVAPK